MRVPDLPLVPIAAAFAAGTALGPLLSPAPAWTAWGLATVAATVAALVGRAAVATAPLLVAVAALGALRALPTPIPADHVARLPLPLTIQLEGRLAAEPTRWAPDRARLLIDVERAGREPRRGRVQATLHGDLPSLTTGQRVRAELAVRRPLGFRNPGVFDHGRHLEGAGIHAVGSGRTERLEVLDAPAPPWPVRVRRAAVAAMERSLPAASAALLAGLLLGERSNLPREIDEAFRRAGIYHVLAVSGFNVALLAGSVFGVLALARAGRRPSALAAMIVIAGFAAVVGPEPSVLRAVIMGTLVLAAVALDRDASVLNSLALAALLVLAVRPGDLADPGFQLSFAATLGIVLAPLPRGIVAGALAVSAAAQAAVLPVTLWHFNQVSPAGLVANLAAVPLAGAATVVGLTGVALAGLSEAAGDTVLNATWPLLLALRATAAAAAAVPGAAVHLPAPHPAAVALYLAALGLGLAGWRRRGGRDRAAGWLGGAGAAALVTAVVIGIWPLLRPADGRLRVTVLDVGQGDAIVVEAPDGRATLVDAGPGGPRRLDAGERVVAPFLWNRGHLGLAGAIVTHGDADHAGGMAAVRRLLGVRETWDAEALRGGRPLGGLGLASLPSPSGPFSARNDASVVVRVELGLASFLLASDISGRAEAALVAAHAPLAATVLKVPHHGSRDASTPSFLAAVRPVVAVISVGARNSYGHPSRETLARLAAVGAVVFRTDHDGAILMETDGHVLSVRGWASGRAARFCLDPETAC